MSPTTRASPNSGGSILGTTISGNAATDGGGGVYSGGLAPGAVTLHHDKVIANTAPTNPDMAGDFTFV